MLSIDITVYSLCSYLNSVVIILLNCCFKHFVRYFENLFIKRDIVITI